MEENLNNRLENAVERLEALSPGGAGAATGSSWGTDAASDPSIAAFDDLKRDHLDRISSVAEKIGGEVLEATNILQEAFSVFRELLIRTRQTQKPDSAAMGEFLKPLNEVNAKASAMIEGKKSDYFNHLKVVADSLSALVWIGYTGKGCGMSLPIAHIEESWQMAEFYSNKVLVEYRSKDTDHEEWVKALKELYLPGLKDYVKNYYPLGPAWGTDGKATIKPPPAPRASHFSSRASSSSSHPQAGLSAVFQEINTGNASSGLRKVTDDMKSKNRGDRTGHVSASKKSCHSSSRSHSKTGPPKLELQMGRKWVVENQVGKKDLVIEECDAKQSVYVYGCKDCVVQIKGKVNIITLDKCSKTGILFKDVVAAFEVVNCSSVEVQCQGSAPTISVDNTSGCQVYLSKEALSASITTAKCSEINVLVAVDEGDWTEYSLPQHFIHEYKDGQFVSSPVSHSGGG